MLNMSAAIPVEIILNLLQEDSDREKHLKYAKKYDILSMINHLHRFISSARKGTRVRVLNIFFQLDRLFYVYFYSRYEIFDRRNECFF